jgi:hypothetical protein
MTGNKTAYLCAWLTIAGWALWFAAACSGSWMMFAIGCAVTVQACVFMWLLHLDEIEMRKREKSST